MPLLLASSRLLVIEASPEALNVSACALPHSSFACSASDAVGQADSRTSRSSRCQFHLSLQQ